MKQYRSQIWLYLFSFRAITLKHLNSLISIDTLSYLSMLFRLVYLTLHTDENDMILHCDQIMWYQDTDIALKIFHLHINIHNPIQNYSQPILQKKQLLIKPNILVT